MEADADAGDATGVELDDGEVVVVVVVEGEPFVEVDRVDGDLPGVLGTVALRLVMLLMSS